MGKKSNITHQALKNLNTNTRYGKSKFADKETARQQAKENDECFYNVRGIYSTETYKSYSKVCKQFISYTLKNHSEVRNFNECRKYVEEFLEHKQDEGRSAYTLGQYGSALACAYNCGKRDFDFEYPTRHRADIKRSRGYSSYDYRYPQERYDDTKTLLKATGCRRMEALRLRKEDFRETPDGHLEVFKRGKGGLERWCLVLDNYKDDVMRIVRESPTIRINGEDRILTKAQLPKGSVHDLRADYAKELYSTFEENGTKANGKIYRCRKELSGRTYDKGILDAVSQNLSHSRTNVVVSHYLWK